MRKTLTLILLSATIGLTACSSIMYSITERQADNKIMVVDKKHKTFGYHRIVYSMDRYELLADFVKEEGMPDFLLEHAKTAQQAGYHEMRLYYMNKKTLFVFASISGEEDSLFFVDGKPITKRSHQMLLAMKKEFLQHRHMQAGNE